MSRHLTPRLGQFAAILVLIGFAGLFPAPQALAHEVRPAYLDLREDAPGSFDVLFKTPMRGDARLALDVVFSGLVKIVTPVVSRMTDNAMVQTWRVSATEPIAGQVVRIDGLASTMTDALVRIDFIDGGEWVGRLTPGAPQAMIPARQDGWAVAATYLELGVEHIMLGIDHLLFVLALILIAPNTRQLILAITSFTVAHSVTLAAATLGFVNVPPPPIEAAIALSIAFVAAEIIRAREGEAGIATPRALGRRLCLRAPPRLRLRRSARRGWPGRRSHPGRAPFLQCRRRNWSASLRRHRARLRRRFPARAASAAALGYARTALSHWYARHVLGDPARVGVLNKSFGRSPT